MKLMMQFAGFIVGVVVFAVLLVAGISASIYYPWASDCNDAGNTVQEYGYGTLMVTSTFVCVDDAGNIVAVL